MNTDKIQGYAFSMLIIQLSFVLVGLSGIFPFSLEVAGVDVYADIQKTADSIRTTYQDLGGGGIASTMVVSGIILFYGVKICLEFFILVFIGAGPFLVALGVPLEFALPISLVIGAVCVYTLAVKFLGR